ncbi:hypothetical protein [Alkalimarinus alittae]|uniref:Uncharacterized protein n=1 Tax=Alkalimarinus alittae TaxID=2961619 RepID=A0ABY6N4R7_9ALTE|nr:hypothetical protein [Alkalimarinus alittae]UZE97121.1 hypothetical protein NKI27_05065 [Alkalimarinus alittae]
MDSTPSKMTPKDIIQGVIYVSLLILFIYFLTQSPKDSDWIYYSVDGDVIRGESFERCRRKFTNDYGKCHYYDILSGADISSTVDVPDLGPNVDGVYVRQYANGLCQVFASSGDQYLRILIESGRDAIGSSRLSTEERKMIPLVSYTFKKSFYISTTLSYREPTDFVSWQTENLARGVSQPYGGRGWIFSKGEDQIVGVGLNKALYPESTGVISTSRDGLEDRSLVEPHEKAVIALAFSWRDEQIDRFSSLLKTQIPLNCDALK